MHAQTVPAGRYATDLQSCFDSCLTSRILLHTCQDTCALSGLHAGGECAQEELTVGLVKARLAV